MNGERIKENGASQDRVTFNVNIGDKVSHLVESYYKVSGTVGGMLIFNGQLINTPDDHTFHKLFAPSKSIFTMSLFEGSCGKPQMWKRFGRH